jgi:hypothetical protein
MIGHISDMMACTGIFTNGWMHKYGDGISTTRTGKGSGMDGMERKYNTPTRIFILDISIGKRTG